MDGIETNKQAIHESKPKWVTARLIIGIISLVLFVLVAFQSCAAGIGNVLFSNGEMSGTFGFLVALNLLFTGIIAVVAHNSTSRVPWLIAAVLLWFNYFIAKMFRGSFTDLVIWGFVSFVIGTFYMFSAARSKKGYIVTGIVSIIYLIAALV